MQGSFRAPTRREPVAISPPFTAADRRADGVTFGRTVDLASSPPVVACNDEVPTPRAANGRR